MSVPKLVKSKSGIYYVSFHDGKRSQRTSLKVKSQADAEAAFAKWLAQRGKILSPPSQVPISQAWDAYFHKHIIPNTRSELSAASIWKTLEPHFGLVKVGSLSESHFDTYMYARMFTDKVESGTIRKELQMLNACIRYNRADVPTYRLPTSSEPRSRWLTTTEIHALTSHLSTKGYRGADNYLSQLEIFVWIALETASRKQAILDLTWKNVDLDDGVIRFKDPSDNRSSKKRADVPISDSLRVVLVRARNDALAKGVLFGADVKVVGEFNVNYQLEHAAITANIGHDVTPHTLRHTAATHMARNGVSLWKIAKILGNSMFMVESVYAKWSPDSPDGTVNKITGGKVPLI